MYNKISKCRINMLLSDSHGVYVCQWQYVSSMQQVAHSDLYKKNHHFAPDGC